mmetsp:Transcript_29538/g.69887  ORF Transcript_29538/g.69887 Transcript_29538/m.69887 type:complete len:216 (+) Transcript_29538:177-824(+)
MPPTAGAAAGTKARAATTKSATPAPAAMARSAASRTKAAGAQATPPPRTPDLGREPRAPLEPLPRTRLEPPILSDKPQRPQIRSAPRPQTHSDSLQIPSDKPQRPRTPLDRQQRPPIPSVLRRLPTHSHKPQRPRIRSGKLRRPPIRLGSRRGQRLVPAGGRAGWIRARTGSRGRVRTCLGWLSRRISSRVVSRTYGSAGSSGHSRASPTAPTPR